ncbi:uncharacterized protein SPSC_03913 [Sporisorium scitamineum]|uniref:Uncharacterized protein n=1 Tax=Sporisorium scitamineum TaxID=49012 RepID=A0A0F7RV84_9BASI|nr:uncharacterized protein SPSC_03913 [Sporisorium scitamineum]CDR98682.1 hypothetical protein [Sporisorium scitamineum]
MASSPRTQLPPLTHEQQEYIIKQRMQVDERTLRRLIKKLTLLLSSKDAESIASSRLSFKADLEAYRLQLLRLSSIAHGTCQVEINSYTAELSEIEAEQQQTQQRIDALKQRLQDVRRERKNKLEYDVVAGEIVKLPTRMELEESLGRLSEQLEGVKAEREKYVDMSKNAAERMDVVINELVSLRNDVGFEVGERERREVERADGDADGDAGDAAAADGSHRDDASESGAGRKGRSRKLSDEPEEGEEEEGEDTPVGRSGSSTPRRLATMEEDTSSAVPPLNPSAPTFRPTGNIGAASARRKRDSTAITASDEEGEVGDGSSAAAASNSNTPRKRQRTEEGEVGSEEEEGSIQPSTVAPVVVGESRTGARAGTKRRR